MNFGVTFHTSMLNNFHSLHIRMCRYYMGLVFTKSSLVLNKVSFELAYRQTINQYVSLHLYVLQLLKIYLLLDVLTSNNQLLAHRF